MAERRTTLFWRLDYHGVRENYRVTDDAVDDWLGYIVDTNEEPVVYLNRWFAAGLPFGLVKDLAYSLVGAHAICFNVRSTDPMVNDHFTTALRRYVGLIVPRVGNAKYDELFDTTWKEFSAAHDAELT